MRVADCHERRGKAMSGGQPHAPIAALCAGPAAGGVPLASHTGMTTTLRERDAQLDNMTAAELRALVRRDEAALEAVDAGVYVLDASGNTTYVNEAAVRILGYSARELLGKPQHDLIHSKYFDGSPFPVDQCPIYSAYHEGVTQRVGGDVFWKRDGTPLPVDYVAIPVREGRQLTGAVVTFRDATEQVRAREQAAALAAEKALREGAERTAREVEQVADSIPQLAWMTDATGYRNWYNRRWYAYTGTTLEEMQGWGWQRVHDPGLVEGITERYKAAVARGEAWEDTFPLRGANGEFRWFLSRALPLRDAEGKIVRWFGTNTDVTEHRDAIAQRDAALADARAAEEQLERIFEQAPAAISTSAGPEHRVTSANAQYRLLVAKRDLLGRTMREIFPELAGQGFIEMMDQVYATGEPYVGRRVPVEWDRDGSGTKVRGVFDFIYQPLRDARGQVTGLLTLAVEIVGASAAMATAAADR